jgi:predicted N-acetyltransferase YhbS
LVEVLACLINSSHANAGNLETAERITGVKGRILIVQPLQTDDIPAAMRLVETAGWNQTHQDWLRILSETPTCCFKAVEGSRLAGTVTATTYGTSLGWIGMMLVDPALRRRGIGSDLMRQVITSLKALPVKSICLDATPMGQPVYERLGFKTLYTFYRWRKVFSKAAIENHRIPNIDIPALTQADLEAPQLQLDRQVFGYDRRLWLKRLQADSKLIISDQSFGMIRQGRIADYLGPLIANELLQAERIIRELLANCSSDVFLDYPGDDPEFEKMLASIGFSRIRPLIRMFLDEPPELMKRDQQFAISDPATG